MQKDLLAKFTELSPGRRYCREYVGAAAKRFREIAAHAALKVKGDTTGAQAMLEHLHSVPFDMGAVEVDDVVPLRKCGE